MSKSKWTAGDVVGRLTVVERQPSNRWGGATWLCLCTCGKSIKVDSHNLGRTTNSCGCLQAECRIPNGKKGHQGRMKSFLGALPVFLAKSGDAFRLCLTKYKKDARYHERVFDLTPEQFKALTSAPCHYCGASPANQCKAASGKVYIYNGIDRKMNSLGYTFENSLPCCWPCNKLKARRDYEEFLSIIRKIARIHGEEENQCNNEHVRSGLGEGILSSEESSRTYELGSNPDTLYGRSQ